MQDLANLGILDLLYFIFKRHAGAGKVLRSHCISMVLKLKYREEKRLAQGHGALSSSHIHSIRSCASISVRYRRITKSF